MPVADLVFDKISVELECVVLVIVKSSAINVRFLAGLFVSNKSIPNVVLKSGFYLRIGFCKIIFVGCCKSSGRRFLSKRSIEASNVLLEQRAIHIKSSVE